MCLQTVLWRKLFYFFDYSIIKLQSHTIIVSPNERVIPSRSSSAAIEYKLKTIGGMSRDNAETTGTIRRRKPSWEIWGNFKKIHIPHVLFSRH